MAEQTKMSLIRNFKQLADENPSKAAVYFGRTFITLDAHPASQQAEYLQAVSAVVRSYNGATYQTPRPLDEMLESVPHGDTREILQSFALALKL